MRSPVTNSAVPSSGTPGAPTGLLCDLRHNPLGVSRRQPTFSWRLGEGQRSQRAYQIQLATVKGNLESGVDLHWDSDKVVTDHTTHILYDGPLLAPGTMYYWRVRSWNEDDVMSFYSDPASFVTGLWDGMSAEWIWAPVAVDTNQHVFLRNRIVLPEKPIRHVLAFVSADDYYKLYINGNFVGQGPAPGYSDIEYHYNTIDVTAHIRPGDSVCIAGHAYYQGLKNYRWVSGDGRRGFILQLSAVFEDGTVQTWGTDTTWRALVVPGYRSRHILGMQTGFNEDVDTRHIPRGWQDASFDDTSWPKAAVVDGDWNLHPQETDMLDLAELSPVEVVQKGPGHYFFDFGKEVVGTGIVKVDGKSEDVVEMRLGEELAGPQTVRHDLRSGCLYQDTWTLRGGEQEIGQYDYRGFRYGEILAPPGVVDHDSIRAIVRHYPADRHVSSFRCSDEMLNRLWELTKYSTIMGTQEVYVDCPTREQANYSLDAYLTMSAAWYQTGEANFGRRMVELLLQSDPHGKLRCLGPAGKDHFFTEYTIYPVLMAWRYYMYTADRGFLQHNYPGLRRVVEYFRQTFGRSDGLLQGTDAVLSDLVDWPRNRRDRHEMLPVNVVVNAVYYRAVSILARVADIVGDAPASTAYTRLAEQISSAVNSRLWNEGDGRYVDGMDEDARPTAHASLHANVFPLAMGLVPAERVNLVISHIQTRGLACNTFLAMFLFEALYDHGASRYAYDLLTADGVDSPMHMVRQGATTTWETWALEQKPNASLFHPATAFTGYIIASRLIGITPLEPGFKRIRLQPQLAGIESASIKVLTLHGSVRVECETHGESWTMQVEIPPNTEARVYVPRGDRANGQVSLDGQIMHGRVEGDFIVVDRVGPGRHWIVRGER